LPYLATLLLAMVGGKGLDQIPGVGPEVEQTHVDAAVATMLDEELTAALKEVDGKLEKEVSHLKEGISDKLGRLKDAIVALKELSLTKMSQCQRERKDILLRLRDLEKNLVELERDVGQLGMPVEVLTFDP